MEFLWFTVTMDSAPGHNAFCWNRAKLRHKLCRWTVAKIKFYADFLRLTLFTVQNGSEAACISSFIQFYLPTHSLMCRSSFELFLFPKRWWMLSWAWVSWGCVCWVPPDFISLTSVELRILGVGCELHRAHQRCSFGSRTQQCSQALEFREMLQQLYPGKGKREVLDCRAGRQRKPSGKNRTLKIHLKPMMSPGFWHLGCFVYVLH